MEDYRELTPNRSLDHNVSEKKIEEYPEWIFL